jgi:hypothetical protein
LVEFAALIAARRHAGGPLLWLRPPAGWWPGFSSSPGLPPRFRFLPLVAARRIRAQFRAQAPM